jgi:pimeloyl-ACP methyl ester carboxylesterase
LAKLAATIPVGLYTGGRSHPALRLIAAELAERLGGGRLLDVPEAGHAVQMAKDTFVDALLALADDADHAWEERSSVARADANRE